MHVSIAKRPPQSLFVQVDKLRKVTSSWRKQYNDSSLMRIEVRRLYHRRYIYIYVVRATAATARTIDTE